MSQIAARVTGPNPRTWYKNGQVKAEEKSDNDKSLKQKLLNFILPQDMEQVHEDYPAYRKWHALATATKATLGFLGTQGVVTGLAAALNTGVPFVGGALASLGLSGLLTFGLKDGLNWVGNLVGGSMAHKVDEDPKKWIKIAGSVKATANAAQATLVAVPGAFLALAPLSGLAGSWADNLHSSADVKVQNHQAPQNGLAELVGRDKNQDMLSGMIGSAVGASTSILGHALLVPVLGPLAPLVVLPVALGLNLYANHRAAQALEFNNLTQKSVARVAHETLTGSPKLPGNQPEVVLGSDGSSVFENPAHRDKVLDLYGDTKYLVDIHEGSIEVTLRHDATPRDVLQAAWQGQLLADLVSSPGYAQLKAAVGEETAGLKASELTLAAASHLPDELLKKDNQIRTTDVRVEWEARLRTQPLAQVSDEALRNFMRCSSFSSQSPSASPPARS